jgi:hypothetical protein
MRHCQLDIMQQNKIREIDLEPILPRSPRLQHLLDLFQDLFHLGLEQVVDRDDIDL